MSELEDRFTLQAQPRELALFGDSISYTPAGASAKTISAVILKDTLKTVFDTGTSVLNYDLMEIYISSRNNTEGQVTVKVRGKDGVAGTSNGDSLVISSVTWYVRKLLNSSEAGMHKLLISTTGGPIQGLD